MRVYRRAPAAGHAQRARVAVGHRDRSKPRTRGKPSLDAPTAAQARLNFLPNTDRAIARSPPGDRADDRSGDRPAGTGAGRTGDQTGRRSLNGSVTRARSETLAIGLCLGMTLCFASPGETGGNPMSDSPLRGTYWKLVGLHGAPVQVAENQREPHLIFANFEPRVSGSGGCNRVTGSFELDGNTLRLGQMAATRMACLRGMEQEQAFLQSMTKVERYRISGSHLDMLDAQGAVVARFEAVALR